MATKRLVGFSAIIKTDVHPLNSKKGLSITTRQY